MAQDTTNTRFGPMPGALRQDAAGAGAVRLPAVAMPSRRALWTLGAVVLLGHLVLLQTLPQAIAPPDRFETRTFTTRTIVVAPPAPKPVETTPAAAAPTPVAKPPTRKAARPKPRPVPPVESPDPAAMQATAPADATTMDPPPVAESTAEPGPAAQAPAAAASAPGTTQQAALPQPPPSGAVVGPTDPPAAPQATASALTLAIPGSTRLKYDMTGEGKKMAYRARGELLWLQDGQSYDARLEASALFIGSRVRTSSGKITERGLAPTRFSEKTRSELATHFERDKGQVSFSANRPSVPLANDMQDQLSVLLQVASMIAGDPAKFPANTTITLPVAGPRDADIWTFTLVGDELSTLPAGQTATVKIIRNPRKEFDQKVEAWLAPGMGYMPVRLKITNPNADFFDMQLLSAGKP